jgi:hypothetical protein
MTLYKQLYLNKDRSFVMLTSSIRLCSVLYSNDPESLSNLLTDSFS